MSWDVRRADSRAVTSTGWLHSAHSFAFGPHYDPENLSFGPLLALNVDELQPGDGYPRHRHASIEILTWVHSGVLEHVDASGNRLVRPGALQYLSAGPGIEHIERSASATEPVRVVQMWLASGEPAGEPSYQTAELMIEDALVLAASGSRPAPVQLRQQAAELFLGRLSAGATVQLPAAPYVHLLLLTGAAGVRDDAGHAERLAAEDALRITGSMPVMLSAEQDAEVLVWAMR